MNHKKEVISVNIYTKEKKILTECFAGESLLEVFIRKGIYFSAACGGNGTCGKCKILLQDGWLEITGEDERYFTKEELKRGFRLACRAYPKEPCTIFADIDDESDFEVLGAYKTEREEDVTLIKEDYEDYAFAVDIGTTTIAIAFIGLKQKKTIYTYTAVNQQRIFGADVISRMKACADGNAQVLRSSIQKDILGGFQSIIKRLSIHKERIKNITLAGNTTMIHLLMGFDCAGLGAYPFQPIDISLMSRSFREVFDSAYLAHCRVNILPSVSAYVGGDIVSGLYFCGFHKTDKINLFIDLGTNGEIAIGNRDKIITASVAAGPAFEGGNIAWGMGSIAGAICQVQIIGGQATVRTIGEKEPIGICGTGVIEGISECVREKIIDETGLLADEYFDAGFLLAKSPKGEEIVLTQKDVREVQLAKAAIRAGAEVLLTRYNADYDRVDKVYLAGGFGYKINQEKAVFIGMIARELKDKIIAVGNSALGGAVKYMTEENAKQTIEQIVSVSAEINLSNDPTFQDLYLKYMAF